MLVKSFAIVATFALLCSVAQAEVLFTTQEDFTDWSGGNAGAVTTTGDTDLSTTNGLGNVTDPGGAGTAGALQVTIGAGYATTTGPGQQANAAFLAAMADAMATDADTILLDYTEPATIEVYWQVQLHFNYDGTWTGISPTTVTDNGTHFTAAYNISSLSMPETVTYFQMGVISNNDSGATVGQTFTVDNIRTVPEPASLALLGLGGLMLLRRRH